ncbi:MAG: alpha-amylase family glycosyl hydrolase [Bacteroidota bacterium]
MNTYQFRSFLVYVIIGLCACSPRQKIEDSFQVSNNPNTFSWKNATVYFLLTDRFANGDTTNDLQYERLPDGAVLRNFMGGDFKGITQKIQEGYFDKLGVNAIWFTPPVEQIQHYTDEGTGKTYAYHGYWARDWTALDPNFGTVEDFAACIAAAHSHGIKIMWDAVLNHTGPVTSLDTQWPEEWVRTSPKCNFQDLTGTVECTLVENLPDIRTDSETPVELPSFLLEKWKNEGRLEKELAELDAFFERTGYPRAPKYYLVKWLTDWIREYGIDALRVDTAKHTEADVWEILREEAELALAEWRASQDARKEDEAPFFMTGEVYGYSIHSGRAYDYGDQKVDFYDYGFESLINFGLKEDAKSSPEKLFMQYSEIVNAPEMEGLIPLSYLSSHDDGSPFDVNREKALEAGTKLLLAPGAIQIYYGDETARPLIVEGAQGDANLRSFMNWEELDQNLERNGNKVAEILAHWQKIGRFRQEHIAVGAGIHKKVADKPFTFIRIYDNNEVKDGVLCILDLSDQARAQSFSVHGLFPEGTLLREYYSGSTAEVQSGKVSFENIQRMALIGIPK